MATTYTTSLRLQKSAEGDTDWDDPIRFNWDALDALAALGQLHVSTAEYPSASLNVRVSAGTIVRLDGSFAAYAGTASYAVGNNATTFLWLDDSAALQSGSGWPGTAHYRLAEVTAASGLVTAIADRRAAHRVAGSASAYLALAGGTMADGADVALGTSTGTKIGTTSSQKLGFFGTTPQTQATAVTALVNSTGGTAGGTISDVGSSFSQSTLNNNLASLTAKVNDILDALKRHGLMAT